jgi:hypothetical protein
VFWKKCCVDRLRSQDKAAKVHQPWLCPLSGKADIQHLCQPPLSAPEKFTGHPLKSDQADEGCYPYYSHFSFIGNLQSPLVYALSPPTIRNAKNSKGSPEIGID